MHTRRHFLAKLAATAAVPALFQRALAQDAPAPAKLAETDPTAAALGYKEDTTQVDAAKFPMHKPEQKCASCALLVPKEGAAYAPCNAFGGKLVAVGGWCAAYALRPGAAPAK